MERPFTHVDAAGRLRMVDISNKKASRRRARAHCVVVTTADLTALVGRDGLDPAHAARVAGVFAAKRTADVIPLCHSLDLSDVDVEITPCAEGLDVASSVSAQQSTGVEMEALLACAFAALSLLDALRDVDPMARVVDLTLLLKEGGKSGRWGRLASAADQDRA